jgi:hypothetical protein
MLLESYDAVLDPGGRREYDSDLAAARLQLGEAAFAQAWQEGRVMKIEQAIMEATSNGAHGAAVS